MSHRIVISLEDPEVLAVWARIIQEDDEYYQRLPLAEAEESPETKQE